VVGVVVADERVNAGEWFGRTSILAHVVRAREGSDVVRSAHHREVVWCRHRRACVMGEGRSLRSGCSTVVWLIVVVIVVVLAKFNPSREAVGEGPHARVGSSLETRNTGIRVA